MIEITDWRPQIEWIIESLRAFCSENSDLVGTFFVTGSFVRQTAEVKSSNVNLYFISCSKRSANLRMALANHWNVIRQRLLSSNIDLLVDCHPYTVSYRNLQTLELPLLTVTSKVLDASLRSSRYSLPPTIGLGWLRGYKVLWGDARALEFLALDPQIDIDWYQGIHEALSRYRNLLDHLPWALPWNQFPSLLAQEAFRYAEEALRDGIPVVLTEKELKAGLQFEIYFAWKSKASDFFAERYGPVGRQTVLDLANLKTQIAETTSWTNPMAERVWLDSINIWQVVWEKFTERASAEWPSQSWLRRVNSFV